MQASGRTMSRAELLDQVWGEDELEVGVRAVDNLVCRLRRKLGDPGLLVTVRGIGFRLADR
jgi:two-component system OmpR family response regulator